MFRNAIRLPFRLLGIPVLLDITFLFILPVFAWLIGNQIRRYAMLTGLSVNVEPLEHGLLPYLLGLIAAIGLFVSVLIHELGHSYIAQHYGVKVRSITLWLLGGMAQFEEMPRQRGAEAVVAIAGPITSFALAALFYIIEFFIPPRAAATNFIFAYLTQMNVVLAIFNLLPALPLDGGRVLRSLLALKMPHFRATEISATISKVLAVAMGLFGLYYGGIFLILIAFFIYMAVNAETRQSHVSELLRDLAVNQLMTRNVKTVPPDMTVGDLLQKMTEEHHLAFPVVDGQILGIVTLKNIEGVDVHRRVYEVMTRPPLTISEWESAAEAFNRMNRNALGRLIVTDPSGQMVGIVTDSDLMRAIQIRLNSQQSRAAA